MDYCKIEELDYHPIEGKDDTYFLKLNQNTYYVGYFVIEILELLKKEIVYKEIADILNGKHNTDYFNEANIKNTVEVDFVKSGMLGGSQVEEDDKYNLGKYIYGRVNLIKSENHKGLLKILSALFKPVIFFPVFSICLLVSLLFLYKTKHIIMDVNRYNIYIILAIFVMSVLNTLWHELGHAAAAFRNKVMPKDIGFGFYIIYPTFFTDVTHIWRLSKSKRIMVNIGGIYFQFISNMLFLLLYYLFPSFWFMPTLVAFNTGATLISLNPFFRYDGYWIYTDLFDIPNLRKQSQGFVASIFRKLLGKETMSWSMIFDKKPSLMIYAFLSNLFFGFMFISINFVTINQLTRIYSILKKAFSVGISNTEAFVLFRCIFAVILVFAYVIWNIKQKKKTFTA